MMPNIEKGRCRVGAFMRYGLVLSSLACTLTPWLVSGCGANPAGGQSNFRASGSSSTSSGAASMPAAEDAGDGGIPGFGGNNGVLTVPEAGPPTEDASTAGNEMLTMLIRDFQMWDASDPATNPDFENRMGDDRGIVESALGADGTPVYAHPNGTTRTTHGQAAFDQWYHDVPGVNIDVSYPIMLSAVDGGLFGFDSRVSGTPLSANNPTNEFFPIDDGTPYATAFGNQGEPHNYSFTTELHTVFVYRGGETFSFSGDDDVFVFINGSLVIDLGGVHVREQQSVNLDDLGLTVGQQYPLDLFGAERHTIESNVSFQTSLQLMPPPPR
jgi:fibro-slime domain-containing protein